MLPSRAAITVAAGEPSIEVSTTASPSVAASTMRVSSPAAAVTSLPSPRSCWACWVARNWQRSRAYPVVGMRMRQARPARRSNNNDVGI